MWTTISLDWSGVIFISWTFSWPLGPMPPEMSLIQVPTGLAPVRPTRAPVVASTAARPTLLAPLIWVNCPPRYTVVLVASSSVPAPLACAVNPVTVAPVVGLIEANLRLVTPFTVLNRPATNSFVPSGDASTSVTPESKVGRKAVSTRPVVMLNAARYGWV